MLAARSWGWASHPVRPDDCDGTEENNAKTMLRPVVPRGADSDVMRHDGCAANSIIPIEQDCSEIIKRLSFAVPQAREPT